MAGYSLTSAVTAIVLPLVEGQAHGWPLWTWMSLAAAPVQAFFPADNETADWLRQAD